MNTFLLMLAAVSCVQDPAEITIQRGVQVVVYPDRVRVRYEIALSTESARLWLARRDPQSEIPSDPYELIDRVRELVNSEMAGRLRITVDDQGLSLRPVETHLFPKHTVQLECSLEARIAPTSDSIAITLVDGNFRGIRGRQLMALKAEDGVEIESSTVPLILARVPRQTLGTKTAEQMEAARRATAVLRLAPRAAPSVAVPETTTAVEPESAVEAAMVDESDHERFTVRPLTLVTATIAGLALLGAAVVAGKRMLFRRSADV